MKRGEIWVADLGPPMGNEPGKQRPVLIMQTDALNDAGHTTVMVCLLTSQLKRELTYTRLFIPQGTANLDRDSNLLLDQIRTLDRMRFKRIIGTLPANTMYEASLRLSYLLELA